MQLREAADTLGVHYQTAYAWVRAGTLPARKVGRGYEVAPHDVRALATARRHGAQPARQIRVRDWAIPAERLYAALLAGDEARARQLTARLTTGVSVADLCDRVIGPALRRIGDGWAAGTVSVAQEHRASAICERLIAVAAQPPPGRPRGCAVITTPPGERHGLPALMAAACLREDHWLVHHLAADLPLDDLTGLVTETAARLLVLCTATAGTAAQAEAARPRIAAACPAVTVLVGKPGGQLAELRRQARALRPGSAPMTSVSAIASRE
jgi:excisionase family DNA binding protein